MADSVNRIIPSATAPERYSVLRRELGEKNRQEPQQKNGDRQEAFPGPSTAETIPDAEHDDREESKSQKAKGKILDISA